MRTKFLYLKGIDIFGPFEAEQIVKEDCFSEDLLVCPEDKAEQESAWKSASYYPEFKIALKKEVFPIQETKPIVNTPNVEIPAPVAITVKEKEISQDLPPMEDTETNATSPNLEDVGISFNEVMSEFSTTGKKDTVEEEKELEDHTFHIAHKEDNLLEDLPAHRLIGKEGESLNTRNNIVDDHGIKKDLSNNQVNANDIVNFKEIDNVPLNVREFLEISNNQIISSSDGRVKKQKSNDLLFILSFLVLMVVAIALCMAFWNMMNGTKNSQTIETTTLDQTNNQANNTEGEIVPTVLENKKSEDYVPENLTPVKEYSVEEQVIDIVKNTKLSHKEQTIGEYLQNTYGMEYQSSWSAKPFTDNVYIVEFFASQVRNEPYVYLFRVDVDQKKITGALNNITLDLLA